MLDLHEKGQNIAVFTAAEAVEGLSLRVNYKRGIAVLVKGAAADKIILPTAAQGHVASDEILDGGQ